jgi:cytidine deaminase
MKYRDLYKKAQEMIEYSYAPFSKFRVGAALLAKDGEVFTGCNVENSSLGGTICAERTAMVKAVSEGNREWEAVAIASSEGEAWPCGICRQFMREFVDDDFVIITGDDIEHLKTYTMNEILPEGFKL